MDPLNWKLWVLISLIFKAWIFFVLLQSSGVESYPGFWGEISGDSDSYLVPIENLVNLGIYSPDFRMPGYGILYLPFYFLFSKAMALNGLIILQYLSNSVAVYFLGMIAFRLFQRKVYFYTVFSVYLFTTYVNWYDHFILTESFSISFLIITIHFFLKGLDDDHKGAYLMSGIFLGFFIFLKPVFIPLMGVLIAFVFLETKRDWKKLLISCSILFGPFLILELGWISYNYHSKREFIPLVKSFLGPGQDNVFHKAPLEFTQVIGANYLWWKEDAEIKWFGVGDEGCEEANQREFPFSPEIFTSEINENTLSEIKEDLCFVKTNALFLEKADFEKLEKSINRRFEQMSTSLKEEKPYFFYIQARIKLLKQFLFYTKSTNPFYYLDGLIFQKIIRMKSIAYLATLFLCLAGVVILPLFYSFKSGFWIVIFLISYTVLMHPFALRLIENRYLLPAFPFMVMTSVVFILKILKIEKYQF